MNVGFKRHHPPTPVHFFKKIWNMYNNKKQHKKDNI